MTGRDSCFHQFHLSLPCEYIPFPVKGEPVPVVLAGCQRGALDMALECQLSDLGSAFETRTKDRTAGSLWGYSRKGRCWGAVRAQTEETRS